MEKTSYRFVINAIGKGGETYYTHCQDKYALKKWIKEHENDLIMDELKITDKNRHPLLKFFPFDKLK
ncbi:hypothetical protein [Metabacillus sp. Hm71]|uniref:hypothetical protein n=1 Tax=Metabacillus sp. Hm71 TaxID=3450743 RepID=UPI003F41C9F5